MTFLCRARAVTPRLTLGMAAPYAYGSIAATALAFVAWTLVEPRNCRLFLVVLLVRMWRLNACERLIEPFPRTRKRFFAPDLVFIFGMMPFLICCPPRCSPASERLLRPVAHRLRAYRGDAFSATSFSEPAASPFAVPRVSETVRRSQPVRDRRGSARAGGHRIPDAPSRDRETAASPWPCHLLTGRGCDCE